jgi:hypothetical protein
MKYYMVFIALLVVACNNTGPETGDMVGSWKMAGVQPVDTANTMTGILNETIQDGLNKGSIVFENDSIYNITTGTLALTSGTRKGKYWLSGDGKLLQLLEQGADATTIVEVVSLAKDTLRLKFSPEVITIFTRQP